MFYLSLKTAYENSDRLQRALVHEVCHHILPDVRLPGSDDVAQLDDTLIDAIVDRVVHAKPDASVDQRIRDMFVINETAYLARATIPYILTKKLGYSSAQIWKWREMSSDSPRHLYLRSRQGDLSNPNTPRINPDDVWNEVERIQVAERNEILNFQVLPVLAPIQLGMDLRGYSAAVNGWMPIENEASLWTSPSTYLASWDSYGRDRVLEAREAIENNDFTVADLEAKLAVGLPVNSELIFLAGQHGRMDLMERLVKEKDLDPNYSARMVGFLGRGGDAIRIGQYEASPMNLAHALVENGEEKGALMLIQHPRFLRNNQDGGHSLMSRAIRSDRFEVFQALRKDPSVKTHLAARATNGQQGHAVPMNTALGSAWLQKDARYYKEISKDFVEGKIPTEIGSREDRAAYMLGSLLAALRQLKLIPVMKINGVTPPWQVVDYRTLVARAEKDVKAAIDVLCPSGVQTAAALTRELNTSLSLYELDQDPNTWVNDRDNPVRLLSMYLNDHCKERPGDR